MYVFIGWHDLLMMSTNLDDIALLKINAVDYHCIIDAISKTEALAVQQQQH